MKLNEEIIASERLKMMRTSRLRVDRSKSFQYNLFYQETCMLFKKEKKKPIKPGQKVKHSFAPLEPLVFINAEMH